MHKYGEHLYLMRHEKEKHFNLLKILHVSEIDNVAGPEIERDFINYLSHLLRTNMRVAEKKGQDIISQLVLDLGEIKSVDNYGTNFLNRANELHKSYFQNKLKIVNCDDKIVNQCRIKGFNIGELVTTYDALNQRYNQP